MPTSYKNRHVIKSKNSKGQKPFRCCGNDLLDCIVTTITRLLGPGRLTHSEVPLEKRWCYPRRIFTVATISAFPSLKHFLTNPNYRWNYPSVRLLSFLLLFSVSCAETKTLEVTATAYNSVESQTKIGDAVTAAWGDQLKPGMKAVAVSRDLLEEEGIEHGSELRISGLPGTYRVLDKMNKRWKMKIDIYRGENGQRAEKWGRQNVEKPGG